MEQQTGKITRQTEPRLTIRVSAKTHKRLRLIAVEQETSVQALLAPAIEAVANQQP